jgi:hypothetical protein
MIPDKTGMIFVSFAPLTGSNAQGLQQRCPSTRGQRFFQAFFFQLAASL